MKTNFVSKIKKIDNDKQIVFVEVYAPDTIDTHGDTTNKKALIGAEKYFRENKLFEQVDTMHDNVLNGSTVLKTWVSKGDDGYSEGAWIASIKISDDLWPDIKSGKINGVSMEASVLMSPAVAEIEVSPVNVGSTKKSENHYHLFIAMVNDDGVVASGRTSTDFGHSHFIEKGTATKEELGHSHRFFI